MRSQTVTFAAVLAALTATSCGEAQVDVGKASALIEKAVETQTGIDVRSISCPDEVRARAKASFGCGVTGSDGTKGVAVVTQRDGKGALVVAAPFLQTGLAEQRITTDLRTSAPRATVDCPDVITVRRGATFACDADLGPVHATVVATQTTPGAFTYKLR